MTLLSAALVSAVGVLLAATPTPQPNFDENSVTPGFIGFLGILFIAVAVILLVLDMTRRIRRVRYREEIRAKLEAERDAASDTLDR